MRRCGRQLQKDSSALGKARLHYFDLNKGPWSELDGQIAFLPGVPSRKPLGANFYPEDMSKDEFETWVAKLPAAQQEQARGFFTVIRRGAGQEADGGAVQQGLRRRIWSMRRSCSTRPPRLRQTRRSKIF